MAFAAAARVGQRTAYGDAVATEVTLVDLVVLLLVLAIAHGQRVSTQVAGTVSAAIFFAVRTARGSIEVHLLMLRLGLHCCRVDSLTAQVRHLAKAEGARMLLLRLQALLRNE